MKYCLELPSGIEVTLEVEYEAFYIPAKTYGPPEDCYPEDGELQLTDFTVIEADGEFSRDELDSTIEDALERIEEKCWIDYHKQCKYAAEEAAYARYSQE